MNSTAAKPVARLVMLLLFVAACSSDPEPTPDPGGTAAGDGTKTSPDAKPPFELQTTYVDDDGKPFGRRWVHRDCRMPVTVLRIASVPQAFLRVGAPPISNRGEPHTGEHLLLGKGLAGKRLSANDGMSLIESTAWTAQTEVVYAWNCAAGRETFLRSMDTRLDALLRPDYTDEEVRREVCHVGVRRDPATGELSLEEGGTIYQEMVSSDEKAWRLWTPMMARVHGADHPLGMNSGGAPDAIREMLPEHIHAFHRDHYHFSANLALIVALPDDVPEELFLKRLAEIIERLDATDELKDRPKNVPAIPASRGDADRGLRVYPYPNANEGDAGVAMFVWPTTALAAPRDRLLAAAFLGTLAEGEASMLYPKLMDGRTREVAFGASWIGSWLETDPNGVGAMFAVGGYAPADATAEKTDAILGVVQSEMRRVATLAPKSEELAAFNERARVRLAQRRREIRRQLSSPPQFGRRGGGGFWSDHLKLVDLDRGKRLSVTLGPTFDALDAELAAGRNPWRRVIEVLDLLERPYVGVSVPSAAEAERLVSAKRARLAAHLDALKRRVGTDDETKALEALAEEQAAAVAKLDERDRGVDRPSLVGDLPLTLDPSIRIEAVDVAGVRGHRAVFETMEAAELALYLDLRGIDPARYAWLSVLPRLLTSIGEFGRDGTGHVEYATQSLRRARELDELDVSFATRPERGRHELVVRAAGVGPDEISRLVDWIDRTLRSSWISAENLDRILDVVREESRGIRGSLGGSEESWVWNPARALRFQNDALHLAADSLHARLYNVARLEWRLMPPPDDANEKRVFDALTELRGLAGDDLVATGAAIEAFLAKHRATDDEASRRWIVPIAERIREFVGDFAPGTIADDLARLVDAARAGLAESPIDALAELDSLRLGLLTRGGCRFVVTGDESASGRLLENLDALLASLDDGTPKDRRTKRGQGVVRARLAEHQTVTVEPVHHGLVYRRGSTGVFLHHAPMPELDKLDDASIADWLASSVYGGHGAHGLFMQTWGAGLAYSNGIRGGPLWRSVDYYAERCPRLVDTLRFVVGRAGDESALDDGYLLEYAMSELITDTRAGRGFEERARAAARDLLDGDSPELHTAFRRAVLKFRADPKAWEKVRARVIDRTGAVLPGLGPSSGSVVGGVFMTIAPEPMLAEYEEWIKTHEGEEERVYRVYPRDFWVVR